jgi:hypothetical protein
MWAEQTTIKSRIINISIRKSLLLACLDLQMVAAETFELHHR